MNARHMIHRRERGIASIWVVILLIVLFAFVGLAADVLFVVKSAQELRVGADAASLAATLHVRRDHVASRDAAVNFAASNRVATDNITVQRNDGNDSAGDVVIGLYQRETRTFTPMTTRQANAVRVVARRTTGSVDGPMPTLFGSMFGVNQVEVERFAIAMIGGDIGPGVIALSPSGRCSFDLRGSTTQLTVTNGALMVNSSHNQAACHSGQPDLNVDEFFVTGGTDRQFDSQVDFDGETYLGTDPVPDPLAGLQEPNVPLVNHGQVKLSGNQSTNLAPGYYSELTINNGSATLAPGLYYVDGPFEVTGSANFDASAGVTIFIGPNGRIKMDGGGQVSITPMNPLVYSNGPAVSPQYLDARVSIFQARDNTREAFFRGTNDWNVGGTIYIPDGHMSVGGTMNSFSNGLVANTIEVFGTGNINVDFDNRFPPVPRFVFLVE